MSTDDDHVVVVEILRSKNWSIWIAVKEDTMSDKEEMVRVDGLWIGSVRQLPDGSFQGLTRGGLLFVTGDTFEATRIKLGKACRQHGLYGLGDGLTVGGRSNVK
jgi:hypothetical protein